MNEVTVTVYLLILMHLDSEYRRDLANLERETMFGSVVGVVRNPILDNQTVNPTPFSIQRFQTARMMLRARPVDQIGLAGYALRRLRVAP